ncbi:MAG: signal peptide peptidase SppA [Bacteroidetes bacterium]|jgi:protease-4|nr:signal peptide peptidase SppA [Bacteroidota bacterium]
MRQFFKFLFASFFGTLLAGFIGFFLLIGIMAGMASTFGNDKDAKPLSEPSLFVPELSSLITERDLSNSFNGFSFDEDFNTSSGLALTHITQSMKAAKDDANIKAMFLDLTVFLGGRASIETVYDAIKDFKSSGKPIIAYADYYTEPTYYLASLADTIYMQPTGGFAFDGALMELVFLKGAFEKLGIDPRVIKHGKFKSAGEPLSEKEMSPANRSQMRAIMSTVYTEYLQRISLARGMDTATLRGIANGMLIRQPSDAVGFGLVDALVYRDQVLVQLAGLMGKDKYDEVETIGIGEYVATLKEEKQEDKIAVVYAVGEIGMGKGNDERIGAEGLSETIREARLNEKIKAVVLRVNSPGGSALASDIILREVDLCRQAGKPVVVSMGDVAASGGYYISCLADAIVAQPSTLTGSIGVIGVLPYTGAFFEDKLGVTFDRIKSGPYADLGNPNREMTLEERRIIQDELDRIYINFISHVAKGRNMDTALVNKYGQGRVWTGVEAKEIGLVDELGGLDRAIALAAEKAGLSTYSIRELPEVKNPFNELLNELSGVKDAVIANEMGETEYRLYKQIKWLAQMEGPALIMPYMIK